MNNKEFISKLKDIVNNYKTVYMWGVFGSPVTESIITAKSKQYPSWYTAERQASFRKLIGKGYFGFDCVNLIKAILWGWNGDASKTYGGAKYASNGVPDVSADGMLTKLLDVSSDFSKIEIGEAVWIKGHIGVYIGDGKVIECTPKWKNGVQITACLNIGNISGLNGRRWTKHGKLPYITYLPVTEEKPSAEPGNYETYTVVKGDSLYKIANKFGTTVANLVALNNISNPNLIHVGQVLKISATKTIKVGNKVKVKPGAKTYTGGNLASFVYNNVYDVIQINGDRVVIGKGTAVTAAVHKNDLILQ